MKPKLLLLKPLVLLSHFTHRGRVPVSGQDGDVVVRADEHRQGTCVDVRDTRVGRRHRGGPVRNRHRNTHTDVGAHRRRTMYSRSRRQRREALRPVLPPRVCRRHDPCVSPREGEDLDRNPQGPPSPSPITPGRQDRVPDTPSRRGGTYGRPSPQTVCTPRSKGEVSGAPLF